MENTLAEVREKAREAMQALVDAVQAAVTAAGYTIKIDVQENPGGYYIAMDANHIPRSEMPRFMGIFQATMESFQFEGEQLFRRMTDPSFEIPEPPKPWTVH